MGVCVPWSLAGDGLQVEQFVEVATGFMAFVGSCRPTAACPSCGEISKRIHSRYERRIADLPWSGRTVAVTLRVRRFLCRSPDCPQRLFTERLPGVVGPYARRTD